MAWGLGNKLKKNFIKAVNNAKNLVGKVIDNSGVIGDVVNQFAPGVGDKIKQGAKIAKVVNGAIGDGILW